MADLRAHSSTSNIFRLCLKNSSTGRPLTGLDHTSSGLIISTIADNEATATIYSVASSNVETITTLGTFAAPTSGKCRFKAVDGTNHPGLYEIHIADARFSVASAKRLVISLSGATNLLETDYEVELTRMNLQDGTRGGMTALPNAAAGASGGLWILGSMTGSPAITGSLSILNTSGNAMSLISAGGNGSGLSLTGNGSAGGLTSEGGATGAGAVLKGGATSGHGLRLFAQAGNSYGALIEGAGSGAAHGVSIVGAGTGYSVSFTGTLSAGAITATSLLVNNPSGTAVGFIGTTGGMAVTATAGDGVVFTSPSTARGLWINGGTYGMRLDCTNAAGVGFFADSGGSGGAAMTLHGNGGKCLNLEAPTSGADSGKCISSDGTIIYTTSWAAGAINAAAIASDAITSAKVAASAVDELTDAVWDEAESGHVAAGSFGAALTSAKTDAANTFARLGAPNGASVSADIANAHSDIGVVLARIGAFAGTGVNTILGFLRAMANKAAGVATPSELSSGGTFNNTTDALEAQADTGGSLTAGQQAQLDAIETATALITAGGVTVSSPVSADGQLLTIVRGDTYNVASGQPITFTAAAGVWPDLTGATAKTFTIRNAAGTSVLTVTPTITAAGAGTQSVRVDLTSAETAVLVPGDPPGEQDHAFDLQVTLSDGSTKVTLVLGAVAVLADVTTT